jgi:hypothetical protein
MRRKLPNTFQDDPSGKEHVEGVLEPARPPRTLPNLVGRCDEQQGREEREGKRGL